MIDKFHTLEDLKGTNLKMIGSCISDWDIPIGELYLQPSVISMWDFKDYNDYYTYFDDSIKLVVNVCVHKNDKETMSVHLNKDLSNISKLKLSL